MPSHVALLRAIAHVPMAPFRAALEALGLAGVTSFGMSGNLIFDAGDRDVPSLEAALADRFGTAVAIRSRDDLAAMIPAHPDRAAPGPCVMALLAPPAPGRLAAFAGLDFLDPRPRVVGRDVLFTYPATLRGRRTHCDLEKALGVAGTARATRVMAKVLARLG